MADKPKLETLFKDETAEIIRVLQEIIFHASFDGWAAPPHTGLALDLEDVSEDVFAAIDEICELWI